MAGEYRGQPLSWIRIVPHRSRALEKEKTTGRQLSVYSTRGIKLLTRPLVSEFANVLKCSSPKLLE